jgi:hypothetical protein
VDEMGKITSGHVQVRVPVGWKDQDRALVIQINSLFDDLYRKIAILQDEINEMREEDSNGGTNSESASEETGI